MLSIRSRLLLSCLLATIPPFTPSFAQNLPTPACPAPALNRLQPHVTTSGETIASIAQTYQLFPETIANFNPLLPEGTIQPGTTVVIPPYNGFRINVPQGASWQDLAEAYGVRADVLFELNGCQAPGAIAFIPRSQSRTTPTHPELYEGLSFYPLAMRGEIGLAYGWYERPGQGQTFHNGLDILAPVGTVVQAADPGEVVFTGTQGDYGQLVVINHANGRQTRYAHLDRVQVQMGDRVTAGQEIGRVGTSGRPDLSVPHLHFEVRQQAPVGWIAQDPILHLNRFER